MCHLLACLPHPWVCFRGHKKTVDCFAVGGRVPRYLDWMCRIVAACSAEEYCFTDQGIHVPTFCVDTLVQHQVLRCLVKRAIRELSCCTYTLLSSIGRTSPWKQSHYVHSLEHCICHTRLCAYTAISPLISMACHVSACSISPPRPHLNIRTPLSVWPPSRLLVLEGKLKPQTMFKEIP